ncbi:MAG: site-specific integrase, partial [Burkholderiaceae bacterium]
MSVITSHVFDPSIDIFIDALWLEEGLAKNSLAAYRRDLQLFDAWLSQNAGEITSSQDGNLLQAKEADLHEYFASRHATTKATSANRRLTVLKRFYRWALRERMRSDDPTLKMLAAKQAMRVPKTLTETQIENLLL